MKECYAKIAANYAAEHAEETKELLKVLGKIPAPSHQEDKRVDFVRRWFMEQCFSDVTVDCAKNVICKLGPCDGDLTVFEAHTDIVFPDTEELAMKEEGSRLYAPGIGDDTANLTNLMIAARWFLAHQKELKKGLLVVANSCEEGLGNLDGTKELFRVYGDRIKQFYSLDGHTGGCRNGAVGSYRYRVTCRTVGGHSYGAFGNPNAIERLSRLILDLYKVTLPDGAKTTFNVGVIEGGTTVNSIAQRASMLYEFRSPSQSCLEYMQKFFNDTVAAHQSDEALFEVEVLGIRPGDGPLDRQVLEAYTNRTVDVIRTFYDGEITVNAASTDSNVPLSMGIAANTFGTIVGAGSHTREEWVDLNSVEMGLKITLSMMLTALEIDL